MSLESLGWPPPNPPPEGNRTSQLRGRKRHTPGRAGSQSNTVLVFEDRAKPLATDSIALYMNTLLLHSLLYNIRCTTSGHRARGLLQGAS